MSLMGKTWSIQNEESSKDLLSRLLENRGIISDEERKIFLSSHDEVELHDPFLFLDMRKAVDRVQEAIEKKQRIVIFGDYDADGISGAAVLVHALRRLHAEVSYRLPHRVNDGYGMSMKFIEEFKKIKADLLITVDCGISNGVEIAKAKEYGIDVIITDHHTVPKNAPEAYAIIHPLRDEETYPFRGLTGSGVAFKLAQALYMDVGFEKDDYESLLDLASLGTVADMGPLQGENRAIVKKGLHRLRNTKWKGLELLTKSANLDSKHPIGTGAIGFQICPRINAAGRIDTPYAALQLLLHEMEQENSQLLANKLEELNNKRREMTQIAVKQVQEHVATLDSPRIIVHGSPEFHVGIVGLIASRVVEEFGMPAIIMQDFGDRLVGSCRSLEVFNITEALASQKDLLDNYGGHVQAAGFSIQKENLEEFTAGIMKYAEEKLAGVDLSPALKIDLELPENHLDLNTVDMLEKLQPFGIKNRKPVFLLSNCELGKMDIIGPEKNHIRIRLNKGGKQFNCIGFSMGRLHGELKKHRKIDVVGHLERNDWKGKSYLQFRLVDIRPSK